MNSVPVPQVAGERGWKDAETMVWPVEQDEAAAALCQQLVAAAPAAGGDEARAAWACQTCWTVTKTRHACRLLCLAPFYGHALAAEAWQCHSGNGAWRQRSWFSRHFLQTGGDTVERTPPTRRKLGTKKSSITLPPNLHRFFTQEEVTHVRGNPVDTIGQAGCGTERIRYGKRLLKATSGSRHQERAKSVSQDQA